MNDDYEDERFGYSNWLDGGPEHASQPSAADLTEDYLPVDTDGSDTVDHWAACPICGESDHDNLVNRDGIVHCATCGHDYDLEPERTVCAHPESAREAEVYVLEPTGISLDGIGPQYERRYYWIDRMMNSNETSTGAIRCGACMAVLNPARKEAPNA